MQKKLFLFLSQMQHLPCLPDTIIFKRVWHTAASLETMITPAQQARAMFHSIRHLSSSVQSRYLSVLVRLSVNLTNSQASKATGRNEVRIIEWSFWDLL